MTIRVSVWVKLRLMACSHLVKTRRCRRFRSERRSSLRSETLRKSADPTYSNQFSPQSVVTALSTPVTPTKTWWPATTHPVVTETRFSIQATYRRGQLRVTTRAVWVRWKAMPSHLIPIRYRRFLQLGYLCLQIFRYRILKNSRTPRKKSRISVTSIIVQCRWIWCNIKNRSLTLAPRKFRL